MCLLPCEYFQNLLTCFQSASVCLRYMVVYPMQVLYLQHSLLGSVLLLKWALKQTQPNKRTHQTVGDCCLYM